MVRSAKRRKVEEDSLDIYLKEISSFPLLAREEEAGLARGIRKGDPKALEKLARSNLRFVVSVAKKYQNQGLSLPDLINEGNLGLVRAAYKFDETRGIKFISYAVWWIRQAILKALAEQSKIVRIPLSKAGAIYQLSRRANSLSQELGREPTYDEMVKETELDREEMKIGISLTTYYLSLQDPIGSNDNSALLESIPDDDQPDPEEETFRNIMIETLHDSIDTLKEREAVVLRMHFGLGNHKPMSLEAIGSTMGLTRERIRQIKEKAISRLRHISRSRELRSLYN